MRRTWRSVQLRSCPRTCLCRSIPNRRISWFFSSSFFSVRSQQAQPCAGPWPGCLLASAGFLCRSGAEKKLAHLARRPAGDGTLARPCDGLVHISGFKYPETTYVLLRLDVRPVGDEHVAVSLGPQRLGVAGRGKATRELSRAGSNHLAVERVYRLDRRFGFDRRVVVIRAVDSNQILWH